MNLQRIPRTAVCTWLRAARIPVEAVARFGRNGGESSLVLAFEAFEAGVKHVAGSILGDEELVREGRVEHARVREVRNGGDHATTPKKVATKRPRPPKSNGQTAKTGRKQTRKPKAAGAGTERRTPPRTKRAPARPERPVVDVEGALDAPNGVRESS